MIKKTLIFLISLLTNLSFAQIDNVNVGAKYIIDYPGSFLVAKKDSIYTLHYRTEFNDYKKIFETRFLSRTDYKNIDEVLKLYQFQKKDLTLISNLRKDGIKPIINDLKKIQFNFKEQNTVYNVIDYEYVVSRLYTTSKNNEKILFNSNIFKLIPVTINNQKTVFYINNEYNFNWGYIIPTKNNFKVSCNQKDIPVQEKINKTDSIELQNIIRSRYPIGKIYQENKKYGLKTASEKRILIAPIYESIYYSNYFIIAKRFNKIELFYKNGEKMQIDNIRDIQPYESGFTIIKDNKLLFLNNNGEIVSHIEQRLHRICGGIPQTSIKITEENDNFLETNINGYHGENTSKKVLSKITDIKNITFLHNSNNIFYKSYDESAKNHKLLESNYIVETNEGKFTIASFISNKLTYNIEPNNYKFLFNNFHAIQFELNGLFGLYPFQTEPKYKTISKF